MIDLGSRIFAFKSMSNKDIILGGGQVGRALKEIFESKYNIDTYDRKYQDMELENKYRIMHICFPYDEKFVSEIKNLKNRFL